MSFIRFGALFALLGLSLASFADVLALREDHPQTYIVKKGDTLWDISSYFLRSPWLWPRLWQANPQVNNPHLIYPGDRLNLIYVDGQPRLVRKKMVKLTPQAHTQLKKAPVPTLPLSIINPFLSKDHIASAKQLENTPLIIGNNKSDMILQKNQTAYIQGDVELNQEYGIYRASQPFIDKETDEVLGIAMVYLGSAKVTQVNADPEQPHTIKITESIKEIKMNDLLLPVPKNKKYPAYFTPSTQHLDKPGYIVASYSHRTMVSKYDIVLINKGLEDGVKAGHVFAISEPGVVVVTNEERLGYKKDASNYSAIVDGSDMVQLPDDRLGELMVFRAYDKLSYALILRAEDIISQGDNIINL